MDSINTFYTNNIRNVKANNTDDSDQIQKDSKLKKTVRNDNAPFTEIAKLVVSDHFDGYQPQIQPNTGIDSGKYKNHVDDYQDFYTSFRFLATDMTWIIAAQSTIIANNGKLQQLLLNNLDTIFATLNSMSESLYNFMQTQVKQAQEAAKSGAFYSGLISFLLGLGEVVMGVALVVFSSGIGAGIGAMMIIDGIMRTSAGMVSILDPDQEKKNKIVSQMEQAGIFSVFTVFGDKAPQIAQTVGTVVMGILSGGSSLLFSGIGLLASLYNLSNAGLTIYGIVGSMTEAKDSKEAQASLSISQAATMGAVGCVLYGFFEIPGVRDEMKDIFGENWANIAEMVVLMAVGIVANIGMAKLFSSLPETRVSKATADWANFMRDRISNIKLPGILANIELPEKYKPRELINQVFSQPSIKQAMTNANIFSSISQSIQAWLILSSNITNKNVVKANAVMQLVEQTYELKKTAIQQFVSISQNNQSLIANNSQEMANLLQTFTNGLFNIINNESKNSAFGG